MKRSELRKIIREELLKEAWKDAETLENTGHDVKGAKWKVDTARSAVRKVKQYMNQRKRSFSESGFTPPITKIEAIEKKLGDCFDQLTTIEKAIFKKYSNYKDSIA